MIYGAGIGAIELLFFFVISYTFKQFFSILHNINSVYYYWLCMTILTGIWEVSYITNYYEIVGMADELVANNTHVWTNKYTLDYILPWKLSKIFYAEYGAWADREYMSLVDGWSHTIEGSHAIFCGLLSLFGMILRIDKRSIKSIVMVSVAMGAQLMNSILYMIEYFIQCNDENSINYNTTDFPMGTALSKRAFMYVNVLWLIMPAYIILYEICNVGSKRKDTYIIMGVGAVNDMDNPPKYEECNIKETPVK